MQRPAAMGATSVGDSGWPRWLLHWQSQGARSSFFPALVPVAFWYSFLADPLEKRGNPCNAWLFFFDTGYCFSVPCTVYERDRKNRKLEPEKGSKRQKSESSPPTLSLRRFRNSHRCPSKSGPNTSTVFQ